MSDTDCIRQFMTACGQAVAEDPASEATRLLRARLVLSEALELCAALGVEVALRFADHVIRTDDDLELYVDASRQVDHVEAADACADLRYVVVGTEVALGIPGDAVFAEVHRSNMTKLVDGVAVMDDGGKVLKPPSYEPPDVAGVLERCREGASTC